MADLQKLNKTIEELETNSNNIKNISETLGEMGVILRDLETVNDKQDTMQQKTENLQTSLIQTIDDTVEQFDKLNNKQKKINNDILEQVKEIANENTKLYMDQKRHFDNQLELNFTENSNRNKKYNNNLVHILNETGSKLNGFNNQVNKRFEMNKKSININRILIGLTLLIGIGNVVLYFI